jgi:DNA-binding GntR family transcriptional regulator
MTVSRTPAPGPPGTTQQHAVRWLREAIVTGGLRPGERVNQERIAAEIGVSVAPVREALRVLEQEGQVTYRTRRGYCVTELRIADLEEIYALRRLVETHVVRASLPGLDADDLARLRSAAEECVAAARADDVVRELEANRRFHFGLIAADEHPHAIRHLGMLWDATEAYRALYYNDPRERENAAAAHERIVAAVERRDADALVAELDAHREQALVVLRAVLGDEAPAE